jgi:SNF2 family DNA or RNA helicase
VGWKNLDTFRDKIAPALFSLSKHDPELAAYLTKQRHHEWTVALDHDTWNAYEMIATELVAELNSVTGGSGWDVMNFYGGGKAVTEGSGMGRTAGRRIALEMLLDHPDLLRNSAREYTRTKGESGSEYAAEVVQRDELTFLQWSPKLTRLYLELFGLLKKGDPKVMIFSRYPAMLKLISASLPPSSFVQYDGTMTPKQKAAATARFRSEKECKYFLSSHAGAKGNDMPMASWLINYDMDWTAGTVDQINGRHVRASSEFDEVHIVNMVCRDTVEERKVQVVDQKRDVSNALVRGNSNARRIDNDVASLRRFLIDSLGLAG